MSAFPLLFLAALSLRRYKQNSQWFLVTLAILVITRNEGVFLGMVNPHNADYVAQREFSSWLMHYQPDYLLPDEEA